MIPNALRVLAALMLVYGLWRMPLYWEAMNVGAISMFGFLGRVLFWAAIIIAALVVANRIARKQAAMSDIKDVFDA